MASDQTSAAADPGARLRLLGDAIPHQVWTAGPDGKLDYVNQRVLDDLGASSEEILGKSWLAKIHPDDVTPCIDRWKRSLAAGEPFAFEFRLWIAPQRRYRRHVARALPQRDAAGQIVQWCGTNTDVEDERTIQDNQQLLLEAGRQLGSSLDRARMRSTLASVCVPLLADWCMLDEISPDGSVRRVGLAHSDPARAPLLERLERFPMGSTAEMPSAQAVERRQSLLIPELTAESLRDASATPEHFELIRLLAPRSVISTPLIVQDRVVGALSLVYSDASNRRYRPEDVPLVEELARRAALALDNARLYQEAQAAAERSRRLVEALERSNRDLDQFAYVASHDLKSPLRGIANLAEWIAEDLGPELGDGTRQHLDLMHDRVRKLEALIDGILRYARAGRVKDAPEQIDTAALLAEAIELLAPPEGATITVGPNMPTIRAERAPIQQVFMNLIGNALKYANRADPRVEIRCEDGGHAYHFSVADNGPGIDPKFHERVFGVFQTLGGASKGSSGLGLSIVKRVVETRGGSVWIESTPPHGATFHFLWLKDSALHLA